MAVTLTYETRVFTNEFVANGFIIGDQFGAEAIGLTNGGYAVVYGTLTADYTVPLVTIYDANGVSVSSWTVPYSNDSNDVDMIGMPEVIQLANGNLAVIWDATNAGAADVVGAIIDPVSGLVVYSQFEVSPFNVDTDPEATALANGNWVVAMTSGSSIYLQVMNPTGIQVNAQLATGISASTDPVIAALTDGGFVVAYTVNDGSSTENSVYGTIYNGDGSIRTDTFEIGFNGIGNDNRQPAVAALQNGNWAIVYTDSGWVGDALTLQIFSPTGDNLTDGVYVEIDDSAGRIEVDPDITVLANGFIAVTWTFPFDADDNDIHARIFDQNGDPVFVNGSNATFSITDSFSNDSDASIGAMLNGMFITAWTDDGGDGFGDAVDAQVNGLVQVLVGDGDGDTMTGGILRDRLEGNGGDDSMFGDAGRDTLQGGDGNDTLNGGAERDSMAGGANDDLYYVNDANDVIVEVVGEGANDRVATNTSYVLAAGVEIERMTTTAAAGTTLINLTGNEFAQQIFGNAGQNVLTDGGGAGADVLNGAGGSDHYIVGNAGTLINESASQGTLDQVWASVSFALAADDFIEVMRTTSDDGTDPINLTGNARAQTIIGNAGINTLHDGGTNAAGNDTLQGNGGNDVYRVFNAGTVIVEGIDGGTADRVTAAVSFALAADDDIEIMTTNGSAATSAINLTGNARVQDITGNAGANQLGDGGGAGIDTLRGLGGNDTYIIRNAATQIIETAGRGTGDRVSAAVSFVLAADDDIELMTTTSAAGTAMINLTGNALAQSLTGNAGANRLDGGGGNDTMNGGDGADTFVFTTALGVGNVDRINNFVALADSLELENAIFTGLGGGTLTEAAFRANTTGNANDASDRIIYETDTGNIFFDADGTGAGARVLFAVISPNLDITRYDFNVV